MRICASGSWHRPIVGVLLKVVEQPKDAVAGGGWLPFRMYYGPEFTGSALLTWVHRNGVTLWLIEPGKPNQNAYVESLSGRLRDECLNEH
jgi:transposase InsO family protein